MSKTLKIKQFLKNTNIDKIMKWIS